MSYCLKCDSDISELINFDTLLNEFIECPNCGNKMMVEYDESYDSESGEENSWFWVEQYKNDE